MGFCVQTAQTKKDIPESPNECGINFHKHQISIITSTIMEVSASEFSDLKNIHSWEMLPVLPGGELKTIFSKITIKKPPQNYFIRGNSWSPLHIELFPSLAEILHHKDFFSVWQWDPSFQLWWHSAAGSELYSIKMYF